MSEATVNDLFYDLSKEDMEKLCPSDLRVAIRKAFDLPSHGDGPGPTMQEVIDHYNDERNYRLFRHTCGNFRAHEALDAMVISNVLKHLRSKIMPWSVPSIVEGSNRRSVIGSYDFEQAMSINTEEADFLTRNGWGS